jgi:hypothetical protein
MNEDLYLSLPETLSMREIRCGNWIIISTLTEARTVDKAELYRLYQLRWQVELDLRSIKSVMQMDVLRCKCPPMIEKEIAAHLCAYNRVRLLIAQAAHVAGCLPRLLSFKTALQTLRAFEQTLRQAPGKRVHLMIAFLLGAIAQQKLSQRPGRAEPRVVKRRPKKAPLMMRPRAVLKAILLRKNRQVMRDA